MAQNDRISVPCREAASHGRRNTEQCKHVDLDGHGLDAFGRYIRDCRRGCSEVQFVVAESGDVFEDLIALLVFEVIGHNRRKLVQTKLAKLIPHDDQSIGRAIGQRPQHDSIHHREHSRSHTNAERQSQHRGHCEPRRTQQASNGLSHYRHDI